MTEFTTLDILNYYSGTINEERREELELARAENPYVAGLFTGFLDQLHHAFDDHPELANEVDELLNEEELEGDRSEILGNDSLLNPISRLMPPISLPIVQYSNMSFSSADEDALEEEDTYWWRLNRDRTACELSIPIDDNHEITFPYGVALVRHRATSGMLLSQCLMAIEVNLVSARYLGRLKLRDWLGDKVNISQCEPSNFEITEVTDFNVDQIPLHYLEQLKSEIDRIGLGSDRELRKKLENLRERIGATA